MFEKLWIRISVKNCYIFANFMTSVSPMWIQILDTEKRYKGNIFSCTVAYGFCTDLHLQIQAGKGSWIKIMISTGTVPIVKLWIRSIVS
jgi:hypothetical protein